MSKINLNTFDLTQLPTQEDDNFEFKSSQTKLKELKKKLSCAVSGFANSGGGCFIAGVDPDGNADGGFPCRVRCRLGATHLHISQISDKTLSSPPPAQSEE